MSVDRQSHSDNYLRHYQEIHQPLSTFYECPVMVGHFRVKRRGDLTRHLRKMHPELSEGRIRALVNKCPHTQRPNPAYVDPGNLPPPAVLTPVRDMKMCQRRNLQL